MLKTISGGRCSGIAREYYECYEDFVASGIIVTACEYATVWKDEVTEF
jgi:hypothetical protein